MTAVFKCKKGKYFVRKILKNGSSKIEDYSSSCAWTNTYKLLNIIELLESTDIDDVTLKYMKKYGIENVRGGSWQQMKLSEDQIKEITSRLSAVTALESKLVPLTKTKLVPLLKQSIELNSSSWPCDICNKKFHSFEEVEKHEESCFRPADENDISDKSLIEYIIDFMKYSVHILDYASSFIRE